LKSTNKNKVQHQLATLKFAVRHGNKLVKLEIKNYEEQVPNFFKNVHLLLYIFFKIAFE